MSVTSVFSQIISFLILFWDTQNIAHFILPINPNDSAMTMTSSSEKRWEMYSPLTLMPRFLLSRNLITSSIVFFFLPLQCKQFWKILRSLFHCDDSNTVLFVGLAFSRYRRVDTIYFFVFEQWRFLTLESFFSDRP